MPPRQIGPRRYQGQFPLWGKGPYQVIAAAAGRAGAEGEPEQAMGGFAVPYSPEYLKFHSDPIVLKQIAERTGGRLLNTSATDLFHPQRGPRESTLPIIDWFLLALACLVPLDVALRRAQLDWDAIRGWLRRGAKESSGETLGALLERKKRVKGTLETARPTTRPVAVFPAQRPPPSPKPTAPKAAPPPSPTAEPTSMTERLLARKRKREQDPDRG